MSSKIKRIRIRDNDYFAIVSFYLGIFGFIPVCAFFSLIFGVFGIFSDKRRLALIGILFSLWWLFFVYLLAPFIIMRGLL